MTVIDIHPHIISDDADRYPPAPLFGKRSDWSQERPCTVASLIAAMDEAGVDKAAVVPPPPEDPPPLQPEIAAPLTVTPTASVANNRVELTLTPSSNLSLED